MKDAATESIVSGIKRYSDARRDHFEGSAESLIDCGIVRRDQLPGMPGNGKVRCTYDAEGRRVPQGHSSSSLTPGRLTVTRVSAARFRVSVNVSEDECERRRQRDHVAIETSGRRRVPHVRLVPAAVSQDTIDCLTELLDLARRGELIGVAFCAMYRRRKYVVDAAGEPHRNPTFARGMVAALDDVPSRRAWDGP